MSKYKIWNKTDLIYTPSGEELSPEQWLDRYKWAKNPNAKMVISGGTINGAFCGELNNMKEMYRKMGATITDDMSDEEVLAAIEDFEDNPPWANQPTIEERTAAALEAQVLLSLPAEDETTNTAAPTLMMARSVSLTPADEPKSPAFARVKQNYTHGLWNASLVNMAAAKGQITQAEASEILNS